MINRDKKIYLYAHSLGTNLVKNSLLELANKNISVEKVHLFGGATSTAGTYEWKNASETVKYGIHNFYSQKDSVLKYLYKTFELGDTPIGLSPISSNCRNIKNYDVSSIVNGHFEYKENLSKILKII
ncbi:TMCO4 family protein [Aliarcobacter butzleri]|uniref:TMCO4 family protein n=1 Tax=Aliarcobacter butzleri TaxID=28197 RepID=UPI0021F6FD4B|nr:TMCO4 family protein [Aliarcobacter butzleri]